MEFNICFRLSHHHCHHHNRYYIYGSMEQLTLEILKCIMEIKLWRFAVHYGDWKHGDNSGLIGFEQFALL